jgi:hypothetical protein
VRRGPNGGAGAITKKTLLSPENKNSVSQQITQAKERKTHNFNTFSTHNTKISATPSVKSQLSQNIASQTSIQSSQANSQRQYYIT